MRKTEGPNLIKTYLDRAKRALEEDSIELALNYARQVLQADPNNEEARAILNGASQTKKKSKGFGFFGRALGGGKEKEKEKTGTKARTALDDLEDLHKNDPSNGTHAYNFALACLQAGRRDDAITALRAAIPENLKNDYFLRRAARLFSSQNEHTEAAEIWKRLKERNPHDSEVDRELEASETKEIHQREVNLDPVKARVEAERDKAERLRTRDLDTKIKHAAKRVAENPDELRSRVWLAHLLLDRGQEEEHQDRTTARELLEKVLTEDPVNVEAARTFTVFYRDTDQMEKALEMYARMVEQAPEDPDLQEDYTSVRIEHFQNILANDPDDEAANEALQAVERERAEREVDELANRVRLNPTNPDLAIECGEQMELLGRIDDAIKHYQAAKRFPQRAFKAYQKLGEAYLKKAMSSLAIRMYQQALELAPPAGRHGMNEQRKYILYRLGAIYQDFEKDIDSALQYLEELYAEDITYRDVAERYEALFDQQRKRDERK